MTAQDEVALALAEAEHRDQVLLDHQGEDLLDQRHDLLAGLRTGDWLDAQVFPPLAWMVPGLVPEGMSLLIGAPKIGKSWLSLDIVLAVASGGRALGAVHTGPPRPVLHLALEDGLRRLQGRARELFGPVPLPRLWHHKTTIEPGMAVATIEAWLNTLAPDAQPLVVLDTLGKAMPLAMPGESPYQRDYRVAGRLKRICDDRPGMALLCLHHDKKAVAEDFVEMVSGTNGIAGAADTIIVISRKRTESAGLFKVTGRDVVEREYAVTVEGGAWRLVGTDLNGSAVEAQTMRTTANLGDRASEIVRFVSQCPDGARAADVAAACDLGANDAARYLLRLHEAGKLGKPERGLYTPLSEVSQVSGLTGAGPTEQDTTDTTDRTCRGCLEPLDGAAIAVGAQTCTTCELEEMSA